MFVFVSDGAPAVIDKNKWAGEEFKKYCKHSRERLISLVSTLFLINKHCVQRVEN
jgi:hypothetical protein